MINRGTTPAIKVTITNGSFDMFDEGYLTFKQDKTQVDVSIKEGVIVDGALYLPRLTQEQTLCFDATKQVKIQLKLRQLDSVVTTNIVRTSIYPVLNENVLKVEGNTLERTLEIALTLGSSELIELDADVIAIMLSEDIRNKINEKVEEQWQAFFEAETSKFNDYVSRVEEEEKEKLDTFTEEKKSALDTYTENSLKSSLNNKAYELKNSFDNNATTQTSKFNNNATSQTTTFNMNVASQTATFNKNASDKTTTFNSNANEKTSDFNNNYLNKVNELNTRIKNGETSGVWLGNETPPNWAKVWIDTSSEATAISYAEKEEF